jgi:trehalose 6-phosphate synthase/phosphatase
MKRLRRRVCAHDVHAWARDFLGALDRVRPPRAAGQEPAALPIDAALARVRAARDVRLLLDYDGTLVPLVRDPEQASPDRDLLSLLAALASRGIGVDIVSGRQRETLERWLGDLPIALWAEHGYWHRPRGSRQWHAATTIASDWKSRILPILEQFTASTPGAHIEVKTACLAWHYRGAPRDFGLRQAHELRMLLGDTLSNQPLEVLEGKKVIEVRLRGVSKAAVAHRVLGEVGPDTAIMAFGDDRTDEDLFNALPSSAVTVAVGEFPRRATCRVEDTRPARLLLESIVKSRQAAFTHEGQRYSHVLETL